MRLFRLLPLVAFCGCAPSLHPQLERIEIPAQCARPLLLLPLEEPTSTGASQESYADAERSVRQILTQRLEGQGMQMASVAQVDSLVGRLHGNAQRILWTRAQVAEMADSMKVRYVLYGRLQAYARGRIIGRSTRLAWELELLDAMTQHPLSRIRLDLRGGQGDPFQLLQESGEEAAAAILKAWEDCPELP